MSALGHKQTFAVHQPMSALPPKADIRRRFGNVRYGQKRPLSRSFNYLVGAGQ